MKKILLLAAAWMGLSVAQAADLTVKIAGAGAEGPVYVALYERDNFLGQPIATLKGEPASAEVVFKDLPPGRYAASVFQDTNGNGKLDRGMFGIPTEPAGFSNDAVGRMGPPKFDAAMFSFGAENRVIEVTLRSSGTKGSEGDSRPVSGA